MITAFLICRIATQQALLALAIALILTSAPLARKATKLTPRPLKADASLDDIVVYRRAEVLSGRWEAAYWVSVILAGSLVYWCLTHHA